MAVFKCKMCGGELDLQQGMNIVECSYCGTKQTVPTLDDKLIRLYNRANQYRLDSEFDKAYSAYEAIISEKNDEAEAYWGMVLSEFGVEYVEDPQTKKRIPTCHRTLVKSISTNENYKSALSFADVERQAMYEDEAEVIDSLQKKILNASAKEEPYDVFICYKETDPEGNRTEDSVLAQEIYDDLTSKGYRVFFSRITLEDKLGKDYEPCIYAALTSAKVMLVVTTDSDNCNSVWVKNEWKRYIDFMKTDKEKTLIPVYKNMSPYALPDEFAKLQAQDMSKIGAIQDLVRGIEKLVGKTDNSKSGLSEDEKKLLNAFEKSERKKKKKKKFITNSIISFPFVLVLLFCFVFLILPEIKYSNIVDVSAAYYKTYALKENGKVVSTLLGISNECDEWTDIVDIDAEDDHVIGLKKDGTVVGFSSNGNSCTDVSSWTDIVAISTSYVTTLGLKSDGTVVLAGAPEIIVADESIDGTVKHEDWTDIVAVSANCMMGLKSDGTVVSSIMNLSDWTDIVAIDSANGCAFGLKSDGTVVAAGNSSQCYVDSWTDIVAISAGAGHTVGLKSDGTVVTTMCSSDVECDVYDWTDIVAISAGENHTVGLKSNGKIVAAGYNGGIIGRCNVGASSFFKILKNYTENSDERANAINEKISETEYESAVAIMNSGDYSKALKIFSQLGDFKDSKEKALECNKHSLKDIKVGDRVFLGSYQNDTNSFGLYWKVLDIQNGKALVITESIIDSKEYGLTPGIDFSWENSSVRKWLNEDFYNASFIDGEKAMIPTVTVLADDGTSSTQDKIFLLSETEAIKYFATDKERECNSLTMFGNSWMLRSIDDFFTNSVLAVESDGSISPNNSYSFAKGVRPAMWIEIN